MKLSTKMQLNFMFVAIFPILVNLANFYNMSEVGEKNRQIKNTISKEISREKMTEAISAEVVGIEQVRYWASWITWGGIAFGLLQAFLIAFILSKKITAPIIKVISGMTMASSQASASSNHLVAGSKSLAEGASNQAASLEEISSSMEQMSSMTKQNAKNATNANDMSDDVSKFILEANKDMERMSEAITRIQSSTNETVHIIKTIDEIAFQTNLLALNAAVEAARAGEAGKGFAVVAEEVRNLAQRSAGAAKNTTTLIEEARNNAASSVAVVKEVAHRLEIIKETEANASTLIAEIAAASKEQAHGIEQVNRGVFMLEKVTQTNAGTAQESASVSAEISREANKMTAMVENLRNIIGESSMVDPSSTYDTNTSAFVPAASNIAPAFEPIKSKTASNATPRLGKIEPNKVIPLDDSDFEDF